MAAHYTSVMPALFFPNLNALRLSLVSGLVPPELACSPVSAGFDSQDRLWLELPELPSREILSALSRLGVQALGDTNISLSAVSCWAALLPTLPTKESPTGPVLFTVAEQWLARFLARLRRESRWPVGVGLTGGPGIAWVTVSRPPPAILREVVESESPVAAYTEQAPGVWVRCGWRHPVPELLVVPEGGLLLIGPEGELAAFAHQPPVPEPEEFWLQPQLISPSAFPSLPPIPVRLNLAARPSIAREALWVFDAGEFTRFEAFCATTDERTLRKLEAAAISFGDRARIVVRAVTGKRTSTFLSLPARGYTPDPRVPGLWVPAGWELRPLLRVRELSRLFDLNPDRLVWVDPGQEAGVVSHSVPLSAFRPLVELIEYTRPDIAVLAVSSRTEPFVLERFAVECESPPDEPEPVALPVPETPRRVEVQPIKRGGGVIDWLQKLLKRFRHSHPATPATARPVPAPTQGRPIERKLTTPDALLHGQDWAARKRELELRLFRDTPRLGPQARAARWADLAAVYAATGNAADAAVCWMNAVWELPEPPVEWLDQWLAAECRALKWPNSSPTVDQCLSQPGRVGVARVIAAYSARAGFAPSPPPDYLAALPRVLALIDQQFDELPVRAAWLARLAATRVCHGDALGLARWRDRVLTRLAGGGPGLDLDEPAFLRFHGTASAERFHAARDWLIRIHKPALDWIREHPGGGRFRAEGLDAEIECTAAYAQLMLAWGLACLGERTRAKDWAAKARKQLSRPTERGVDPTVHALLADLFLHRIRDAQEGRTPKPLLPPDLQTRLDRLPDAQMARYSVNRLRERSRVLEPINRVRSEGGLGLKVFWGDDRLGERLYLLAEQSVQADVAGEADALLELCETNPTTDTLPRVVLTLLEVAPRLEPATLARLLDLLPSAFEWAEAWVAVGRWTESERPSAVARYRKRMLDTAFSAAIMLHGSGLEPAVGTVIERLRAIGPSAREPLLGIARVVFQTLRRLGLRGEAETLIQFLDSDPSHTEVSPFRLGVAAGWFVAGDEDAGRRILDAARKVLFEGGSSDLRTRTSLAIAYAEVLGFAPPGIVPGRLEEIFQRLGPVAIQGSNGRYYALQPLELIDAVVRSVVTDEFHLGAAVRKWLDDDEFLIRGRIHRDLAAILREQNLG